MEVYSIPCLKKKKKKKKNSWFQRLASKITLLCNKFKHQIGILAYLIKSIMRLINQKMQKVKRNSTISSYALSWDLHIFSIAICTFNSINYCGIR